MLLSVDGVCWVSAWVILRDLPELLPGGTSESAGTGANICRPVGTSPVGDVARPYITVPIG